MLIGPKPEAVAALHDAVAVAIADGGSDGPIGKRQD